MFVKILLCVSSVLILQHVLSLVYSLGFHKQVYNHRPGKCRAVAGINTGSEDVTVLKNGLALISSGVDIGHMGIDTDPVTRTFKGRIYLFDFNQPDANGTELPIAGNFDRADFRPHGISAWEDEAQTTLFVVNHKANHDAVEVFSFDAEKRSLQHQQTITDPHIRSVNDLVAVGPRSFYFTNDGYNRQFAKRLLEGLLRFPWGSVVLYDGAAGRTSLVFPREMAPNGINMSPDGRHIYISYPVLQIIKVYKRQADNSLTAIQVIEVGTFPDNIYVDSATGELYTGCHPIIHQLVGHFKDLSQPSPSQVLNIRLSYETEPPSYEIKEVLVDDGKMVSGSTIGAYYNKQLLVGSVLHNLAYCEVDSY